MEPESPRNAKVAAPVLNAVKMQPPLMPFAAASPGCEDGGQRAGRVDGRRSLVWGSSVVYVAMSPAIKRRQDRRWILNSAKVGGSHAEGV